jgi:hypothetical protein
MIKNYLLSFCLILLLNVAHSQENTVLEHSLWEWVVGSEISDKRLNEVAPHFPKGTDFGKDASAYDLAIRKWQKLYCFEYENLINAPELTKLNPYYDGYQDIIQMPYFILPLSSYDKPNAPAASADFETLLDYELKLQAWYFVFQPDDFYHIYRIKPEFPAWFDPNVYRTQIVNKIEESKKHEASE